MVYKMERKSNHFEKYHNLLGVLYLSLDFSESGMHCRVEKMLHIIFVVCSVRWRDCKQIQKKNIINKEIIEQVTLLQGDCCLSNSTLHHLGF